jgi:hypothetical protein
MWKPLSRVTRLIRSRAHAVRLVAVLATVGGVLVVPVSETFACDDDGYIQSGYQPYATPEPAAPVVVMDPRAAEYEHYRHWRRVREYRHYMRERAYRAAEWPARRWD